MSNIIAQNRAGFSLGDEFYDRLLTHLEIRREQVHSTTIFSLFNNGETLYPPTYRPSKEHLKEIIETAFWASLQREEGRLLQFAVTYYESAQSVVGFGNRYFLFEKPIPFNVGSITKLAPAAGRQNFGIAVAPSPQLSIYGLLNQFRAPFLVRTLDPGQLTIGFLGATIAAVSGTTAILIGDYLSTSRPPIWCKDIGVSTHVLDSIMSTLRAMRALHHGGTLIFVPSDGPWRSSIYEDVPYPGDDNFTGISVALRELEEAEFKKMWEGAEAEEEVVTQNSAMVSWWRGRLDEASADLAQLTAVDGATVVTKDFVILGFGVKLLPTRIEKALSIYVTDLLNPGEQNVLSTLSDLGGTRHQSAALLISEQRDATALVVSQDGNISSFIWRDDGEIAGAVESGIYVYRHLELAL